MHITLTSTLDCEIENAIRIAKENNLTVYFDRDGTHGTDDLAVILKFQEAGFSHRIWTYKGKWEEKAIRVEFRYTEREIK